MNSMFLEPDSINYDVFGKPFYDIEHGKIVIFGLPKSGNTWLQSLLISYFNTNVVLTLSDEDRFKTGVLSIHDPFEKSMVERDDFANGVCLIRDIRDIVSSYFFYARTGQFRKAMVRHYYDDIDSFYYEWFLSRCVPAHRMHTFADDYASRGLPVLRYERLQQDTLSEMSRLISRWGIAVDTEWLLECIDKHKLENLKKTGLDIGYKVDSSHFRKGGWGNFLDELPAYIIDDINVRFEHYLSRWGYLQDVSSTSVQAYRERLETFKN